MIVLAENDGKKGSDWSTIRVLDPMWLINCSKGDIEVLYYNRMLMNDRTMEQCLPYQRVVRICHTNGIHYGAKWDSKWFEANELLDAEKAEKEEKKKAASAQRRTSSTSTSTRPPQQTSWRSSEVYRSLVKGDD